MTRDSVAESVEQESSSRNFIVGVILFLALRAIIRQWSQTPPDLLRPEVLFGLVGMGAGAAALLLWWRENAWQRNPVTEVLESPTELGRSGRGRQSVPRRRSRDRGAPCRKLRRTTRQGARISPGGVTTAGPRLSPGAFLSAGAGAPGSPTLFGRKWSLRCEGAWTKRGCRWTHSRCWKAECGLPLLPFWSGPTVRQMAIE